MRSCSPKISFEYTPPSKPILSPCTPPVESKRQVRKFSNFMSLSAQKHKQENTKMSSQSSQPTAASWTMANEPSSKSEHGRTSGAIGEGSHLKKSTHDTIWGIRREISKRHPQILSFSPKFLYVDDSTPESSVPLLSVPKCENLPCLTIHRLSNDTLANLRNFIERSRTSTYNSTASNPSSSSPINQSKDFWNFSTQSKSTQSTHQSDSTTTIHSPLLRSPTVLLNQAEQHNQPIGDDPNHKNPNHLRIILQNPNGIS